MNARFLNPENPAKKNLKTLKMKSICVQGLILHIAKIGV